jgi:hypothetical protein
MPLDFEQAISRLRVLFEQESDASRRRNSFAREADQTFRRDLESKASEDAQWAEALVRKTLEELQNYPPHHARHFGKLNEFFRDGSFAESVFIMCKFPESDSANLDKELRAVIDAVCEATRECGYRPRIAAEKAYHPMLWDNVELHLLGCKRGVAIVEDHYKPELNPNVALDWGWMRAMGKEVLFLVETDFKHRRADWEGFLKADFCWSHPSREIVDAVSAWLGPEVRERKHHG